MNANPVDEYFEKIDLPDILRKEGKAQEALQTALGMFELIKEFVRAEVRESGSFDILSIPPLESAFTLASILEDETALDAIASLILETPELNFLSERLDQSRADLGFSRGIIELARNEPGIIQSTLKDHLESDGPHLAGLAYQLDLGGRIKRVKKGASYQLFLPTSTSLKEAEEVALRIQRESTANPPTAKPPRLDFEPISLEEIQEGLEAKSVNNSRYAKLKLVAKYTPPIKTFTWIDGVVISLARKAEIGYMTTVDLQTLETSALGGLPKYDDIRFASDFSIIALRRVGRQGKGKSSLDFINPEGRVLNVVDLPDILSKVTQNDSNWHVGCRNGRLYAFDRNGNFLWEWVTPGADPAPENPYNRPYPYYMVTAETFIVVGTMGDIYGIDFDGRTLWGQEIPNQGRVTFTTPIGGGISQSESWVTLGIKPGSNNEEVKRAYRQKVRDTHPDHHPEDLEASKKFRDVQAAYERILASGGNAGADSIGIFATISFGIGEYNIVGSLSSSRDRVAIGQGNGIISIADRSGKIIEMRIVGKGSTRPILSKSGELVAAWCDYLLIFFNHEEVTNSIEMTEFPTDLLTWNHDIVFVGSKSIKVFSAVGKVLWNLEFPKVLMRVVTQDQTLICHAGPLYVFTKEEQSGGLAMAHEGQELPTSVIER